MNLQDKLQNVLGDEADRPRSRSPRERDSFQNVVQYMPYNIRCHNGSIIYQTKRFETSRVDDGELVVRDVAKILGNKRFFLKPELRDEIAATLAAMNDRGVYHNDTNLSNILIDDEQRNWGLIDWEFININAVIQLQQGALDCELLRTHSVPGQQMLGEGFDYGEMFYGMFHPPTLEEKREDANRFLFNVNRLTRRVAVKRPRPSLTIGVPKEPLAFPSLPVLPGLQKLEGVGESPLRQMYLSEDGRSIYTVRLLRDYGMAPEGVYTQTQCESLVRRWREIIEQAKTRLSDT
jgi:hypothetical protein